jgi:hypothetical protein
MRELFDSARQARARLACAAAALSASLAVTVSLLLLFHQASPSRWLQPTPELMELLASCQDMPTRGSRLDCTKGVVTAYGQRHERDVRLAQRR